jgi:hypothetical protein
VSKFHNKKKLTKTENNPSKQSKQTNKHHRGVCHTVALPFTLKKYLKAKEDLLKLKCFTMQKYNLQKIL